jgi:surface antigen
MRLAKALSLLCAVHATSVSASLELLAGVEAGIDTQTSMTTSDLARTQHALSTIALGNSQEWLNPLTGTFYRIEVTQHYVFNESPCVSYDLYVKKQLKSEQKLLEACKNNDGQWISITHTRSAL